MNNLHERLEEIARDVFDDESLTLEDTTTKTDVPGWDSLAHVTLMYTLETEFGIQFSEGEFIGFGDIGALKRMIAEKGTTAER